MINYQLEYEILLTLGLTQQFDCSLEGHHIGPWSVDSQPELKAASVDERWIQKLEQHSKIII